MSFIKIILELELAMNQIMTKILLLVFSEESSPLHKPFTTTITI